MQFEHHGRTYDCVVEKASNRDGRGRTAMIGDSWWWFGVTGDRQRYAPFHGAKDDTVASVRDRIVTYYEALVAHRATPSIRPGGGRRPGRPPAVAPSAATSPAVADDLRALDGTPGNGAA